MANRNKDLLKAVRGNNLEKVKDSICNTRNAGFWDSETMYTTLEQADTDAADDGDTALIIAVHKGYRDIAQYLLSKGASVSLANKKGQSPLMCAAENGHKAIMQDLLAKGATLSERDSEGKTPLIYASSSKQAMAVRFLLEQKADVNEPDNEGKTPLMYAADNGDAVSVAALIEKGANIDAQDNQGCTALMYALNCSDGEKAAKLLLSHNARTDIKDNDGDGAEDCLYDEWIEEYHQEKEKAAEPEDNAVQEAIRKAFIAEGIDITKPEQWQPIGDVAIDCVSASPNSPKFLSTVFNFQTRAYTTVAKNVLTGEKSESGGKLEDFSNPDLIVAAYQKLKEMGKNPPQLKIKDFPL